MEMFITLFSSAADRDLSKHQFEGDAFIQGRAAFRDQFEGGHKKLSKTERLDGYVTKVTSRTFNINKYEKNAMSMSRSNTIDEQGRSVVQPDKPSRATRGSKVGSSFAEWTNERSDSNKNTRIFVRIVYLTIFIIIIRKLM